MMRLRSLVSTSLESVKLVWAFLGIAGNHLAPDSKDCVGLSFYMILLNMHQPSLVLSHIHQSLQTYHQMDISITQEFLSSAKYIREPCSYLGFTTSQVRRLTLKSFLLITARILE